MAARFTAGDSASAALRQLFVGEPAYQGRVEAAPHLKNRSACRYCPYSPVCGKEFTAKDVELDKTTPQQALEKMRETLGKGGNPHG